MPVPVPKSLLSSAQDISDMVSNLSTAPAFSGSAMDPESVCLVAVARNGLSSSGERVHESALVDASSPDEVKLEMTSSGTGAEETQVRADVHATTVVRMRVTDKMENSLGNMHGGCGATLVDNLSSMTLYLHTSGVPGSPWSFLGVSQNINVMYLNACPIGSVVEIESYSAQVGCSIALLNTDIWLVEREDGQDSGEGSVHGKGWRRTKKTVAGTHTKVDNSATVKL